MTPFSPLIRATAPPPVMEARRWVAGLDFLDRPLLNLSQAAPVEPPPESLREAMAEMVREADTHLYGPVLGLPALRSEIAWRWSAAYGGEIHPDDVAITSGCNQAFCAAIATLAAPGDAVMLPVPWYFNHKMWLDMAGIATVPLPCRPDMTPDPDAARSLLAPTVRAIVLVTPNNPTGAEYPPALVAEFADIARAHGCALILDETYRDFRAQDGRPVRQLVRRPAVAREVGPEQRADGLYALDRGALEILVADPLLHPATDRLPTLRAHPRVDPAVGDDLELPIREEEIEEHPVVVLRVPDAELAEHLVCREPPQFPVRAVRSALADHERARFDDVEAVGGVALADDHLACPDGYHDEPLERTFDRGVRDAREQRQAEHPSDGRLDGARRTRHRASDQHDDHGQHRKRRQEEARAPLWTQSGSE